MTKMLEELKSYRAGVTLLEDAEGRRWSFCDRDWNGEFWNATEETEDGEIIKGSFAEICELVEWDDAADMGDRVGYVFGGQTIKVRQARVVDEIYDNNADPCGAYYMPGGVEIVVSDMSSNTEVCVGDNILSGQDALDFMLQFVPDDRKNDYDTVDCINAIANDFKQSRLKCWECPCLDDCAVMSELTDNYIDDDGEIYTEE